MPRRIHYLLTIIILSCAACTSRSLAEERAYRADLGIGDIRIGAILDSDDSTVAQGIKLAVEEINQAGGVLGRQIQVVWRTDDYTITRAKRNAQELANDTEIVAVIGHWTSVTSIPASAIYEFGGMLMLSPGATSPKLTQQGFHLIFRNIPSDNQNGQQLIDFAVQQGYQRILIFSAKNSYGVSLGNIYELGAQEQDISVVDRVSYRDGETNFQELVSKWKDLPADAILIAGSTPEAAYFIAQARQAGMRQPVLGGDGMQSSDMWEIGGAAAEGTIITSYFHPADPRPEVKAFVERFQATYGAPPDLWVALAYDAVKVLAFAMQQAGSSNPSKVAAALRDLRDWQGVTGTQSFSKSGDVIGKPTVFNVVRNKNFEYFPSQSD